MTTPQFSSIPLRPQLHDALARIGYHELTPIQAQALPPILQGRDVTAQAATGSGKTAVFALAMLQTLDPTDRRPQGLVLCPTRELADQVAAELRRLASQLSNTRVLSLCGGRALHGQRQALHNGSHLVVGTPGRILQHLRTGHLDLSALRTLVLDEADRMLDMGFQDEVQAVVERCPQPRQTLLFSATLPPGIEGLSTQVQHESQRVTVESRVAPALLQQQVFECARDQRHALVVDLLAAQRPQRALLFCETRSDCDRLAATLTERGAVALPLHGDMPQRDRDEVLLQLANGSASLLVATDVAARGLDIPALPLVLITELSREPESHVHRIGRTGRAGQRGLALSVVASRAERERLERIERLLGHPIPRGLTPPPDDDLSFLHPTHRTLLILAGRQDKLRKADILGALIQDAGLPPEALGRVDLGRRTCAVAVARAYAPRARAWLRTGRIKKLRVRARLLG